MNIKTIVCIGAGASATLVAHHLDRLGFTGRIVLVDRHPGHGPAYASPDPRHVLNVPAGNMGAAGDDPAGFLHWLNRLGMNPPVGANDFVPRQLYGRYLAALIEPMRLEGRLIRVLAAASALHRQAGHWCVELEHGAPLIADAVVLATGNLPPRLLPGAELIDARLIVNDPWRCQLENLVKSQARVLFVGTGLTMVDGVLSLAALVPQGVQLSALSRHGLLPLPWRTQESLDFNGVDLAASLYGLMQQLRTQMRAGAAWECLMNGLRARTSAYWCGLTAADQARFLRHARTYWAIHRHRIPDENHAILEQLRHAGHLQIIPARLETLQQEGHRVRARWQQRGRAGVEEGWFDLIVNATGPQSCYERSSDPLMRQLFVAGHVRSHSLGVGLDATAEGALRGADGTLTPRLYSLGAPMQGVLLECTAIPDIRRAAEGLAHRLYTEMQDADGLPCPLRRA